MAFLRLVTSSLETAGHGIATGATALADEVARGRVPELQHARQDQERRMHAAARNVDRNAHVVGGDLGRVLRTVSVSEVGRVLGTVGVSVSVLAKIVTHPDELRRLMELVETHDFPGLVGALRQGARFPDNFFPEWIRRAGGYFPKFAQVLSVRADLIRSREVLEQFGRCLEDMPPRPEQQVRDHLLAQNWDTNVCEGVGAVLNSGTVAQVNSLTLPDGHPAVVKVSWPDTKRQMQTDFRLFRHAQDILMALRLEDEKATVVGALFAAVSKAEAAVMREFDLLAEAYVLQQIGEVIANEWPAAHQRWLSAAMVALAALPQPLPILAVAFIQRAQATGWRVQVPEPEPVLCSQAAFAMSVATGESLHRLLSGNQGDAGRQEAAQVLIGLIVPFIGWLLLCKSTSSFAHVDPHPGNFRWDTASSTLWVLDWGSHVVLSDERRRALCMLVTLLACDADDDSIADVARSVGVGSNVNHELAQVMRGMLNATSSHAAREAINMAAVDGILEDVADDVVPVMRCLAVLGGILKELQRSIRDQHQQDVPLSLASLWAPLADMGLQT